jgi:competence protein ComEC
MKFPFVPIITSFIIGIYTYFQALLSFEIVLIGFVFSLILTFYCYQKKQKSKFIIAISILFFCFGIIKSFLTDPIHQNNHFTKNKSYFEKKTSFVLEIQQELKPSAKYFRFIALVKQINRENFTGKILFCVKKSNQNRLKIGNILIIYDQIKNIPTPKNKFQFDYQKFMFYKDVLAQCYTSNNNIKILYYQKNIYSISNEIRIKIIKSFEKQHISKASLSIIKALLLGEKQDIDKDMYQSYSKSGAVHVLAISGLHIGIVLIFLLWILKPLKYLKKGNIIITILILLILWSFAFISGMSASVVRAVTMYSFVAVALFINRKTNIINTLWVSLFVILFIYPNFLFDVGFQLSYLAVFSIVYIQPFFKKIHHSNNKIKQYFYDILTVSLAAQLGVMPLSIYYFHQFPGLFFITNLLVIPLITVILFIGFLSIVLCFFIDIPFFIVKILDILVWIMNGIVTKIASFETFVLTNIYSTFSLTIISSFLIFYIFNYLKNKKQFKLKVVLITTIIGFINFYFYQIKSYYQHEQIVFFDFKELVIFDKKGFTLKCYLTNKLINNQDFDSYKREHFIDKITLSKIKNFMIVGNQKILILDTNLSFSKPIYPDVLIIHNNPKINLERILVNVIPRKVIFSPKNYKNNIEFWTQIMIEKKIPFHNMYEKGFYKIE